MKAVRARFVYSIVEEVVIEGGYVAFEDGVIVSVGKEHPGCDVEDLGDTLLMPSLVNAHTHLEFSSLSEPLGESGLPFTDWIRKVIATRNDTEDKADSLAKGLQESAASGVAMVGEIATEPCNLADYAEVNVGGVVFRELIGLSPARAESLREVAAQHLLQANEFPLGWRAGLSPHAPYSAEFGLVGAVSELASKYNAPVAMHLAESSEELELLANGSGPFRELLQDLGAWSADAFATPRTPLDYLRALSKAPQSLVIHGNYLSEDECEFLGEHRASMTLVHCPRTHAHFRHDANPLAALLKAGAKIALGTDSRATNPDLNLWHEAQTVWLGETQIDPTEIIAMVTTNSAEALGVKLPNIEVGEPARMTAIALPADEKDDSFEWALNPKATARALAVDQPN